MTDLNSQNEVIASADTPYVSGRPAIENTDIPVETLTTKGVTTIENLDTYVERITTENTATRYSYDTESGEYLPGVPADSTFVFSTTIPPLKPLEKYAVCFNQTKQAWEYVVDYRGRPAYDTKTGKRIVVLNLYASNVTDVEPTPYSIYSAKNKKWIPNEKILEEARADMLRNLTAKFAELTEASSVEVDGVGVVDAGYTALLNVMSLIDLTKDNTTQFTLHDNTTVEVSKTKLPAIKEAIQRHGLALFQQKWSIRDKITKAGSVAELIEITNEIDNIK